jgi:hypothetical protein
MRLVIVALAPEMDDTNGTAIVEEVAMALYSSVITMHPGIRAPVRLIEAHGALLANSLYAKSVAEWCWTADKK